MPLPCCLSCFYSHKIPLPPRSPLFPYTTLFRSVVSITNFRSLHPLAHESPPVRPCNCRSWTRANDSCAVTAPMSAVNMSRSEEHTSELQSRRDLVCRLLLEKKKIQNHNKRASSR